MGAAATSPTAAVRTVVAMTAASAVHATSAASGSPGGIGMARFSAALELILMIVTIEVKTVSKPNSTVS